MSYKCEYAKQLRRNIRRLNRSSNYADRSIQTLNRGRIKKLAKWENGLDDLDKKIAQVERAYAKGLQKDTDYINSYVDSKIKDVNQYFEPMLRQVQSWCEYQQESFNRAIKPTELRIQNAQNEIARLSSLMNATNDLSMKQYYQRQIIDLQAYLNQVTQQYNDSLAILNGKLIWCSASTPGSVGHKKAQAIAYWENIRTQNLEIARQKWITPARQAQIDMLNNAKQRISNIIAYINEAYDAKIMQYQRGKELAQTKIQLLSQVLSRVSEDCGSVEDCSPIGNEFPICGPNYTWAIEYDPCPYYVCEPID